MLKRTLALREPFALRAANDRPTIWLGIKV